MSCVVTGCTVVVATFFCSVLLFLCLKITFGLHEIIKSVWWTMKMQVILETRTWTWYEMLASWIFQRQPFLEIMTAGRQFHHLSHCLWVLQTFQIHNLLRLIWPCCFIFCCIQHNNDSSWSPIIDLICLLQDTSDTTSERDGVQEQLDLWVSTLISLCLFVVLYQKSCEINGDALARYRLLR